MATGRALLLIADISGYTRFMKVHRVNLAHAQDIVARLLEAVIDGAGRALKLAKLEGDAAFFYAPAYESRRTDHEALAQHVAAIRREFLARREQMRIDQLCNCDGCTQVGSLKLKFVAHLGEVAVQRIKSHTELAGLDVIVVHRMLKNAVPIDEYLLVTDALLEGAGESLRAHSRQVDEDMEGIGRVTLHYAELDSIAPVRIDSPAPSLLRALWGWLARNIRSVPYIVGIRKPCEVFRNMDDALGCLAGPDQRPALPPGD